MCLVFLFSQVKEGKAKTFKKVYAKDSDVTVQNVRTFHLNDDAETEIELEDTVKGAIYVISGTDFITQCQSYTLVIIRLATTKDLAGRRWFVKRDFEWSQKSSRGIQTLLFWEVGESKPCWFEKPGRVKPMTLKTYTCRFLARRSAILG